MKKVKKKGLGMRSAIYLESDHSSHFKIYKTKKGWVCENITRPQVIRIIHKSLKEAKRCLY